MTNELQSHAMPRVIEMPVVAQCVSGTKSEVSSRNHTWIVDEPASLGGSDHGATPVEYALGGFAGVINCMITLVAKEMAINIEIWKVGVMAELDTWGFLGTQMIDRPFRRIELVVNGETTASDAEIAELRRRVLERDPFTFVFSAAGADIEHTWKIGRIEAPAR